MFSSNKNIIHPTKYVDPNLPKFPYDDNLLSIYLFGIKHGKTTFWMNDILIKNYEKEMEEYNNLKNKKQENKIKLTTANI
jgi:hypothetical protein